MGLGLLVGASAAPAKRKPLKRPDLVVTSGRLASKHYVIKSDELTTRLEIVATTKNISKTRAPKTKTGLVLTRTPTSQHALCEGPVIRIGKLRHNETDRSGKSGPFANPCAIRPYFAQICADVFDDVVEANEDNNCKPAGHFLVVPRKWSGTVSGNGPIGTLLTVKESWSGTATFVLSPELSDGRAQWYKPVGVNIHWTTAGTDSSNWSWSGSDEQKSSAQQIGDLRLQSFFENYQGNATNEPDYHYNVPVTCPPPTLPFNALGPIHMYFNAAAPGATKPVHTYTNLDDTFYDPLIGTTYNWDLDAVP